MYMLKIAFITPLLAHYRLSFWEKLSQANADYQLKIFYGTKNVEDGRPNFDPTEVANHAKKQGIFNLEAAYRDLHWKELIDFEKKQSTTEDVETERPNSPSQSKPNERVKLTQDFLKERLSQPDGKEWYEKNRDKIMSALSKGQL